MQLALDHLVVNAKFRLDAYAAFFASLGFTLTPKNRHSLGSVNHLILFDGHYLELIGLEAGGPVRQDILDSRDGIDGLVFKMDEPESLGASLARAGFKAQPLQRFNRALESGETAEFATIRLAPGQFSEGRIYFCQHLTPALVWQEAYLRHPNQVSALKGLTVVSDKPVYTRSQYARLGTVSGLALEFLDKHEAGERFGLSGDIGNGFLAITFSASDLDRVAAYAEAAGIAAHIKNNRLLIRTEDGSMLEFAS